MTEIEVFIPFITCEEGEWVLRSLLERNIEGLKNEGVKRIFVIDGSPSPCDLEEGSVDAEIIRNEQNGLAFAINKAIEVAKGDFIFMSCAMHIGIGTVKNMVLEKKLAEEKFDRPVAIVSKQVFYPIKDERMLKRLPGGVSVDHVKELLSKDGFKFTDEGICIAKDIEEDWTPTLVNLGSSLLVNKDRLFEVGGADERCVYNHGDYDLGLRWISFGYPIIKCNSVRMHRIGGSYRTLCGEGKPRAFKAWMKYQTYLEDLFQTNQCYQPVLEDNNFYRNWLLPQYREEYDRLKKSPFILGRDGKNIMPQEEVEARLERCLKIYGSF